MIKDDLKNTASTSPGLDVLLVVDSCCAAIVGRGQKARGARVEVMVATASNGTGNSRRDGPTFTQHWCEAFTKLMGIGKPFTCDDIQKAITSDSKLEQFPSTIVLCEGWNIPITFLHPGSISESTFLASMTSKTVVTVFHVDKDPNDPHLQELIAYLNHAPVPITVLAALLTSSTLLLLRIPLFFQELLRLQVVLMLTDS